MNRDTKILVLYPTSTDFIFKMNSILFLLLAPSSGVGDKINFTTGLSLTATVVGVRASMAEREQRASELGATILQERERNVSNNKNHEGNFGNKPCH